MPKTFARYGVIASLLALSASAILVVIERLFPDNGPILFAATFVVYSLGTVISFILQARYTFRVRRTKGAFVWFVAVSVLGAIEASLITTALIELIIWPSSLTLVAIPIAFSFGSLAAGISTFLLNSRLTFARSERA